MDQTFWEVLLLESWDHGVSIEPFPQAWCMWSNKRGDLYTEKEFTNPFEFLLIEKQMLKSEQAHWEIHIVNIVSSGLFYTEVQHVDIRGII